MRNNLKFLLLGFLLMVILLLNISFIFAAPACDIGYNEASCEDDGGVVLMRISGNTNAHGALQSQSGFPSGRVVCCYDIGIGGYICTGNNKIIGLSSAGNAHSERPEYDNQQYEDHVCYEFFSDVIATTGNPGGDYIPILSLSSATNAHTGSSSAYSLVVYGVPSGGGAGDECSLQDAYWEKGGEKVNETNNYVLSGTSVELVVEGNELCNGETIDFTITEDYTTNPDGEVPGGTFLEGRADTTWVSQYINLIDRPPRYFFNGEVPGITPIESGLLTVYDSNQTVNTCYDYTDYFGTENSENEIICELDPYEVAAATFPEINCDAPGADCYCRWNSTIDECEGAWETDLGICIFGEQKIIKECDEEPDVGTMVFNWTATWTGNPEDKPENCKPGPKAFECPAQIPLPFFNAYNFLAALLLIAAVYFILSFRKQKKRK